MSEKILDVNILEQSSKDLKEYAIYVARRRAIPELVDGLKPVIRKILWCAAHDFKGQGFIKTSNIMGQVIRKYNPHGDASVQLAIRNMINDFSTKIPTMDGSGSWGHKSNPYPSAPRYTECKISQFGIDAFIQDIYDDPRTTDWHNNYDNKCLEPAYLPAKIPALLVLGQLGIAVGMKAAIPSHSLAEVIDVTIGLMKDPNMPFCLIPDECMPCEIHETDFQKINDTGMGSYIAQGIIDIGEYDKHPALFVKSLPDFTFFDSIKETIIDLVDKKKMPYIVDIVSKSRVDKKTSKTFMEEVIVLSKGADPYFVKEFLYANTAIRQTRQVKLIVIKDNKLKDKLSYREYLLDFIQFRRHTVFRKMNALLQRYKTFIHEREVYIKVMTSGEIDKIIQMIKKQKSSDDTELMEYLVSKLHITSLQAKFILNTDLRKLSMGNLDKYRKELMGYQAEEKKILNILLHSENIDKYIIDEMLAIKAKYATPRMCRVLSLSEAKGIAPGTFKLIFTKKGFIRKLTENEVITSLGDDEITYSLMASNEEDIIIFSSTGKVSRISVSKIPLYAKGSNGTDIRVLNKYISSPIICAVRESVLKKLSENKKFRNYIVMVSKFGYIKRIDMDDVVNTPVSGFIYSKLDTNDEIRTIIFGPDKLEVVVYIGNKILRIPGSAIPHLKRSTKGNRVSTAGSIIEGINFLLPDSTDLIIVTKFGMVNRLPLNIIPQSVRGRAGTKVIKLQKGDSILSVWSCKQGQNLIVNDTRSIKRIALDQIPIGTSMSPGVQMFNSPTRVTLEN